MSQNSSENPETSLTQQMPPDVPASSMLSEIQFSARLHAGPLPPPDVLEQYERMQAGTLDRLLTMAETEQQARIGHNTKGGEYKFKALELRGRNDHSNNMFAHLGQIFGFATVIIFFSLLGYSMWIENITMFSILFCAGAFAGLANLVRSFQKKNGV